VFPLPRWDENRPYAVWAIATLFLLAFVGYLFNPRANDGDAGRRLALTRRVELMGGCRRKPCQRRARDIDGPGASEASRKGPRSAGHTANTASRMISLSSSGINGLKASTASASTAAG
jgi:hypothetical protein